ncbi:hypothetical protein DYE50_03980 [Treponema ruminis]|uniref:Uncharacterized protein n=1 Tax=Treponema ruminis TaxID=744515 RepID=A0A7W8G812_9SPIR|nr:hypothetical protein [Treponema ruminis]MBB5225396.1 hypothetical protein [Treponema ruminis]QSI01733.1 hypothetical protein DYE50_03980 [Treponema ruminis]
MKAKKVISVIFQFLIFIFPFSALDYSPEGSIESLWAAGLPNAHDNAGKFLVGNITASGSLKVYGEESTAFVDGEVTSDALKDNELSFKLREAWADYDDGFWALRAGRQINAWGKADGLQVADILCPKDNSVLIASEYADSRLGIDAIRLSLKGENLVCDAYWIPISQVAKNAEASLEHSEAAVRLASYFPFADFSIYGFYGYDRQPLPILSDSSKKIAMVGADTAIPVKEIVLRAEGAFFPERYSQKNQLVALAGFDWNSSLITITAQYYMDYLTGDLENFGRKAYLHQASLSLSKSFLQDTLKFSFSGLLGLNDFDSMLSFKGEYSITDQLCLTLGSDIFMKGPDKDKNGFYGAYQDFSSAYIKAEFKF